jgi:preprotein translocase subunit YajC
LYGLLHILTSWLQPDVSSGAAPVSGSAPTRGPAGPFDGGLSTLGMTALMMVVMWLVLVRPQQKRQKEQDALLKTLKKGQKVRTNGGIRGEIIDFKTEVGDEVVLMIADRVKINILRSQIAGVIGEQGEQEQKS